MPTSTLARAVRRIRVYLTAKARYEQVLLPPSCVIVPSPSPQVWDRQGPQDSSRTSSHGPGGALGPWGLAALPRRPNPSCPRSARRGARDVDDSFKNLLTPRTSITYVQPSTPLALHYGHLHFKGVWTEHRIDRESLVQQNIECISPFSCTRACLSRPTCQFGWASDWTFFS